MVNSVSAPASLAYRSHFDSERMAGSVPVWGESATKNTSADPLARTQSLQSSGHSSAQAPSLSFGEFLDIINPLQHIPVIGSLYRNMTGDDLSPVAKIIGDGIYGGPIGFATSIVAAAMDEHGGQDALLNGFDETSGRTHYTLVEDERTAGLKNPAAHKNIS